MERNRLSQGRNIPAFVILIIISIIMLLPLFIMVSTSLKNDGEILIFPPTMVPSEFTFSNYITIFGEIGFAIYIKNSLIIAFFVVLGTLLSSSLVAFGFARYHAPFKNTLFMVLLGTLMIPYPVLMIPQFILFKNLGWIDTFLPLIVPAFFGSAYMIFLLRQFFSSLTDELFDAATIDGCGQLRSFWNIALPLCGPALATVAIFSFIWCWDDILGPVIYLNSEDKYTLPVALAGLGSHFKITPWNTMMVGALIAAVPSMCIFIFCQRYFVRGIVMSGIK